MPDPDHVHAWRPRATSSDPNDTECGDGSCRALGTLGVYASAVAGLELPAVRASVDLERRMISGVVIPADADTRPARTSAGPTLFTGRLSWHPDLRRVKMLREHIAADSVGFGRELFYDSAGALLCRFHIPEGPNGDRALADAASGIRDGLSVGAFELDAAMGRDGVLAVAGGTVREVSLVSVPAWDDSRVTSVVASHHLPEGHSMLCDHCHEIHAAGVTVCSPAALTAAGILAPPPAPPAVPPAAGVQSLTASDVMDQLRDLLSAGRISAPPISGPNVPPGTPPTGGVTLAQFAQLAAAANLGSAESATELRAALSDIVPADSPSAFRPVYLAELWDGNPYRRKFIEYATTSRPLPRAIKFYAQRWVTKPVVADYTGNKADVPSGDAVLEDVEVTTKRYAGAHDVDRVYFDLGSPEWLQSYWEAMTESAARLGNAKAVAAAWAGAPVISGDATPPTLMGGVVQAVVDLASLGEDVEYVAMSAGLVAELFGITTLDAPAFFGGSFQLGGQGDGALGGVNWFTDPGIPAGGFMVGAKSAVRWHENTPPIRVQAVNIPQGGVDLGVFGYYATYVRNAGQIRKGTVTP